MMPGNRGLVLYKHPAIPSKFPVFRAFLPSSGDGVLADPV